MKKLFFVRWPEWNVSMILIGSPEIKYKNVVCIRIKIEIYNEKNLYDLLNKKDKEQTEIYNIKTYSVRNNIKL